MKTLKFQIYCRHFFVGPSFFGCCNLSCSFDLIHSLLVFERKMKMKKKSKIDRYRTIQEILCWLQFHSKVYYELLWTEKGGRNSERKKKKYTERKIEARNEESAKVGRWKSELKLMFHALLLLLLSSTTTSSSFLYLATWRLAGYSWQN